MLLHNTKQAELKLLQHLFNFSYGQLAKIYNELQESYIQT